MTAPDRSRRRLPDGFVARLRSDLLRNTDDLLVGGSPLRVLRLSARARECVDRDCIVIRDEVSAQVAARLLDGNMAQPEPHGLDIAETSLTVVVPVRDRPVQLDRCLTALAPLRCVVVDDASYNPRDVAEVTARHGATLIRLDSNVGPAAARNAGLASVRTPYVAFVDSDVEVASGQLFGLAAHFADREVVLVGPLVAGICRSPRPRWFERYDVSASSLDLGRIGARVRPGAHVAWLSSACLVGRVAPLRSLGGFDERLRVGEDVDLVWRLVAAGYGARYDPHHVAHHDTRSSVRGWLGRKFVYGTGGAELAIRHGAAMAPAVLGTTGTIGAAAVLLRRRWSIPVATLVVAASAVRLRSSLPSSRRRGVPLSLDLAMRGLGWSVRQESALLLRHWWPATAVACLLGKPARRMVVTAFAVDTVVAVSHGRGVDPLTQIVCRRLDDLAYGAGLWVGVLRARSVRTLMPRRVSVTTGPGSRRGTRWTAEKGMARPVSVQPRFSRASQLPR